MKLYAISDLHVEHEVNRKALAQLPAFEEDWLILAGDICSSDSYLRFTLETLLNKFAKLFWVPGNHELWTEQMGGTLLQGQAKYNRLVATCREYGVSTPEDDYVIWAGGNTRHLIAPLFLLYDYSFRPENIPREKAIEWAADGGTRCSDEYYLNPTPYKTRDEWCHARLRYTEDRLQQVSPETPLILINHFPFRQDLIRLKHIPRFSIWCGTRCTEDWHTRFPTSVVVTGHLHMRSTDYRDHIRFEEVSLGYPAHWKHSKGMKGYLREILPGNQKSYENAGPFWHF